MAEQPSPISFAPLPFGASVGPPGGSEADLLNRMAQAGPGPLHAGRAGFSPLLERLPLPGEGPFVPTPAEAAILPESPGLLSSLFFSPETPDLRVQGPFAPDVLAREVAGLKIARAMAEAEKKAVKEDVRGMEIARLMAGARRGVLEGTLPDAKQRLVDLRVEQDDVQQELLKRTEQLATFERLKAESFKPGSPALADPLRGEILESLRAEAEKVAIDPDRTSMRRVKDLLVGGRLRDEQERAGGGAINARKIEKDFRAFLDQASDEDLRAMLKVDLQGALAERDAIPGPILDALLVSPLGNRKAHLFARGAAAGATFDASETLVVGVLGERGLAQELAGGDMGDTAAGMLGFIAGAMTNFVALNRALTRSGIRTFNARSMPERVAIETAMQDIPRIPAIVFNGRIQGLSDDTIAKQVAAEVGMGVIAGATMGLGGVAASFTVREVNRMVANGTRGLGRIVREFPEKLPQILDLADGLGDIMTTMVGGVSGKLPVSKLRNRPELAKIARAAQDALGMSDADLGKVVRKVAPKRGKAGDLDKLSVRETNNVIRRLLTPDDPASGVPRGTAINVLPGGEVTELEHVFFAVPMNDAQALRRGGMVPIGTRFHTRPNQAAREVRQPAAEVFALQRTTVRNLEQGASTIELELDPQTLSKTVRRGREPGPGGELGGFVNKGGPFGLDPIELLMSESIHGQTRPLSDELGRMGRTLSRIVPRDAMRRFAYGEASYGMSRNMITALSPTHGPRFTQMLDQHNDLAASLRGTFERRYEDIVRGLTTGEINQVELMADARIPRSGSDDTSRVAVAFRQRMQHNSDMMDIIEAPNPDGSFVLKADGRRFRRGGTHMAQPLNRDVVEAVETASNISMRLKMDPKEGRFSYYDEAKGKFAKLPITGNLFKTQTRRIELYNQFIDDIARQMDEQGMRYRAAEGKDAGSFKDGVADSTTRAELKRQARGFFKDHRDLLAAQQFTRFTPQERDLVEGGKPRTVGAIDFARRFKYNEAFIRPNFGDNYMRHIRQVFDRKAESVVFGQDLERLGKVVKDAGQEVNDRLTKDKAEQTMTMMRQLYARETGNLAIDRTIDALDFLRANRRSQVVRNLTAALFLGPGSTFTSGGNAIWAVMGGLSRLPITKTTLDSFAFGELAATGVGAFAGSQFGKRLGDTPEEREQNAALLMIAGGLGTFGASLFRDSTARALTPVALTTAAGLAGFFGPDADTSPLVRGLSTAAATLAGAALGGSKAAKGISASSKAVRAARDVGALSVGGLTQADLVTNALSPAFREGVGVKGPLGEYTKEVLFGMTQAWEVWARASSAKAGLAAASGMIDKLTKTPALRNQPEGKFFLRELERAGLSRKTVFRVIDKNEGILPDELAGRVMRRFVDNTQYSLRPLDLPLTWSSPWGRWFTQFMGMQYRQFQNVTRYAFEEAGLGNWAPLRKVIPIVIGAGLTVQEIRDVMNGRDLAPRAKSKAVRFVQIVGPASGLFEIPLRVGARAIFGDQPLGQAVVEGLIPPSIGAAEQVVDALFGAAKSVITDDPDIRKGRTAVERAGRVVPAFRTFDSGLEHNFPTDDDRIRQFSAQMPRRLQEIEAAKAGMSLTDFLQRLPETSPQSPFFAARRLAERAVGSIENVARNAASGIGFLPVAPSKRSAEEKADAVLNRLAEAPGLLEREAAFRTRVKGEGQKDVTAESLFTSLKKRAASDARKGIIDRIVSGIRDDDNEVMSDNVERFIRMGGKAPPLISALRQRATNTRDESLATTIPEDFIHAAEIRSMSLADVAAEFRRGPRNPARARALRKRIQSQP